MNAKQHPRPQSAIASRPFSPLFRIGLASMVFTAFACGGPMDEEFGELEPEGSTSDELTFGGFVLLQNVATGRCLRRESGVIQLAEGCDFADVRQRFALAHALTPDANRQIRSSWVGADGIPACLTKNGGGAALTNEVCDTVTNEERLLALFTGTPVILDPRQTFHTKPIAGSVTDFILKNAVGGARCVTDDGSGRAVLWNCTGTDDQVWRQTR